MPYRSPFFKCALNLKFLKHPLMQIGTVLINTLFNPLLTLANLSLQYYNTAPRVISRP